LSRQRDVQPDQVEIMAAYHSKEMVGVAILSILQHQGKMIDSHMALRTTTMGTTATMEITVTMATTTHPHQALAGNPLLRVWPPSLEDLPHHPRRIMGRMHHLLPHTVVMMDVVLTEVHLATPDLLRAIPGEAVDEVEPEGPEAAEVAVILTEVETLIEEVIRIEGVILTGTIPGADAVKKY